MKPNNLILTFIIMTTLPALLWAGNGDKEKRFQLGGRTAIISGTMELSNIDPAFDDLSADGIKGPHHSGIFFLYTVKPWLRVGIETLVGNSDENEKTTMDFQAAGPVIDFSYGKKFFVAGGLHLGGIIADALSRDGEASETKVRSGTFYKNAGFFLAPYIGAGIRFQKFELSLFFKDVTVNSAEDRDNIDAFSASYYGISYAVRF